MKIASIHLQNFKRFTDLKIQNIPATAKLVVLLGPNGCGKSSVFDALYHKSRPGHGPYNDHKYYPKMSAQGGRLDQIDIEFHNPVQSDIYMPSAYRSYMEKAIYVRTAYRNDPVIDVESIPNTPPAIQKLHSAYTPPRFDYMIENDVTVSDNYQRLISNALEHAFRREDRKKTLGDFQDETLGEIQEAMNRLFPDLMLNSLGNSLSDRSFTFDKGTSKNFLYQNLSGGEKAAFDLLFDIFVKRGEYDDTVFCIDEPEAHMNPRLQGDLLEELFRLMNDKSQLWIATHAIGMMRKALQLYEQHGEKIVFLDFDDNRDDRDFDSQEVVIIEPEKPDREFWERTHKVALDDLAALVVPDQIVICEGKQGDKGLDAECYNQIFSEEFPNTKFISAGGKRDLQNYISVVGAVTKGAMIFGLRDIDQATSGEMIRLQQEGIKVLRGKIEDYLLADDVLGALCQYYELEPCDEKVDELMALRKNVTDIKKAADQIRRQVTDWGVSGAGDSREGFLRDTVAPRIKPGMPIYDELKQIIFGS